MTATGHALVATIIAAKFSNPAIGLPICLFSHFACDILPHWDEGTHWRQKTKLRFFNETVFDVILSFTLSFVVYKYIFLQNNFIYLYSCMLFAQLPDWLSSAYLILGINNPVFIWVYRLQRKLNKKLDKPWGIVTQIGAIVMIYFVLYRIF